MVAAPKRSPGTWERDTVTNINGAGTLRVCFNQSEHLMPGSALAHFAGQVPGVQTASPYIFFPASGGYH